MVKNKRYKKYINQKGFLKLPMFRKLIVLTAPNGETVPRDFYIEEKVTQVVDSTDSNLTFSGFFRSRIRRLQPV